MTALAGPPYRNLTEYFEDASRILARAWERPRLELIDGKVRSKAGPDGNRGRTIQWLTRTCLQHRPELWLYTGQGLKTEPDRCGRARPDGSLAPSGAFAGQGEWADADPVLMAVEVTAYDPGSDHCVRVEKPRVYGRTGISLYLLIDREACRVTLHGEPDGDGYRHLHTAPFGKELYLPDPVRITLETEPLKDWAAPQRAAAPPKGRDGP